MTSDGKRDFLGYQPIGSGQFTDLAFPAFAEWPHCCGTVYTASTGGNHRQRYT